MPDVLIRNLDEQTLHELDRQAEQLGIARAEHIRRILRSEAERRRGGVTAKAFEDFAKTYADLADPEVMKAAWD